MKKTFLFFIMFGSSMYASQQNASESGKKLFCDRLFKKIDGELSNSLTMPDHCGGFFLYEEYDVEIMAGNYSRYTASNHFVSGINRLATLQRSFAQCSNLHPDLIKKLEKECNEWIKCDAIRKRKGQEKMREVRHADEKAKSE